MIKSCDILIPADGVELSRFACVACDQFTGDASYWENTEKFVGDKPSALKLTFPEIYLGRNDPERTAQINENMRKYLAEGVFREIKDSVIYVERTLNNGKTRKGIIAACDLEEYEYSPDTHSHIRPTEATIADRLPPRVEIRRNALLELPHIMLLINDEKKEIMSFAKSLAGELLYSTPLMLSGGSIKGWRITGENAKKVTDALESVPVGTGDNVITLAVGDGNHSLATAKKCWEELKPTLTSDEREMHPARYALCEIVDLHDDALEFEPIHRIVYNVDVDDLLNTLSAQSDPNGQKCIAVFGKNKKEFALSPTHSLTVGTVQNIIDAYSRTHSVKVDYIHEAEQVEKNALEPNTVGLLIPGMSKSELFPAVIANGALPRKTFSMGMGIDKRYYLEARKIK